MAEYQEFSFYSATLGGNASRLSICDNQGHEFFVTIPRETGKKYRDRKAKALALVMDAIERGDQPGECLWPSS